MFETFTTLLSVAFGMWAGRGFPRPEIHVQVKAPQQFLGRTISGVLPTGPPPPAEPMQEGIAQYSLGDEDDIARADMFEKKMRDLEKGGFDKQYPSWLTEGMTTDE